MLNTWSIRLDHLAKALQPGKIGGIVQLPRSITTCTPSGNNPGEIFAQSRR